MWFSRLFPKSDALQVDETGSESEEMRVNLAQSVLEVHERMEIMERLQGGVQCTEIKSNKSSGKKQILKSWKEGET